jgi:hypothetical protein
MKVPVEMVNAVRVEGGCPADQAVYGISLFEQEFRQVGSILTGDAGDECFFHNNDFLSVTLCDYT